MSPLGRVHKLIQTQREDWRALLIRLTQTFLQAHHWLAVVMKGLNPNLHCMRLSSQSNDLASLISVTAGKGWLNYRYTSTSVFGLTFYSHTALKHCSLLC